MSVVAKLPSKQVGGPGAPTEVCRPGWQGSPFPGIVATGMLSRSQVAQSWVVSCTGLSEMS